MSLSRLAPPRKRRIVKEKEEDDNEVAPSRDDLIAEVNKLKKGNEDLIKKNADKEREISKLKERLEVESSLRKEYQVKLGIPVKEDPTDVFPLLSLPKEIITYIYSFLPIKDRMRARLNKKLDAIELNSNYSVKHLTIKEMSISSREVKWIREGESLENQQIIFFKTKKYSSDGIRRILNASSVEEIRIQLSAWKLYHFEIFNMIKDFNFGKVEIHIQKPNKKKEITVMDNSLFFDLSRSCKHLYMEFSNYDSITPEALHQLYNEMNDRSTNLREFSMSINEELRRGFLLLIGISSRGGVNWRTTDIQLYSNRNIEAYKFRDKYDRKFIHIFDGNLEIILRNFLYNWFFKMFLHETQASLDEAKNNPRFVRIDLTPK